ncbi:MAG: RraA family protein [Candidatus Methanofastidiosa archaeon]|nr:RraA family protein [Candidatus Methanofastidiosa archaeon]NYT14150.1 RraA family protein [Candidatus Methanofastidiosa archaeon]
MEKKLRTLDAASINDALRKRGSVDESIKSIKQGDFLCGPAYTAKCCPGDMLTALKALDEISEGQVLVIDGGGITKFSLFGDLMAMQARLKKLAGVVVDGAIRDVRSIRGEGIPVFCRGIVTKAGTATRLGEINVPVVCGGVIVNPGDWIVGDDDGVVVIPKDKVEVIIHDAEETLKREAIIREAIEQGKSISKLL